jgi:putative aminopeptidase FrvX
MQFLRCNLINKHGSSNHQGEVLIVPSEIESIRSFIHTDHVYSHHEIGSIVTMKTGDKHYVSQHIDSIGGMLQAIAESDGGRPQRPD